MAGVATVIIATLPTLPSILTCLSAFVIAALGLAHLVYTFHGPKLAPRDPALLEAMKADSPGISKETTMWRAWVGFNASHSMGAILYGLVFGYLALAQPALLFESAFLPTVGFVTLVGFLALARSFWFSIPFRGIGIALACFVAGQAIARL